MRAAIVSADLLAAAPETRQQLARLADGGLQPVVLVPQTGAGARAAEEGGYPTAGCPTDPSGRTVPTPDALAAAALRVGVPPAEAYMVSGDQTAVAAAVEAGLRPVLVLGGRTLADLFGHAEPPTKHVPVAADLATAVRYALDEAEQDAIVGPFPFGPAVAAERPRGALGPSARDLAVTFGVIVVAGIAVALGIAYLLQELYQTVRFPPIAYWMTLQFIPQTWRGVLFLVLGAALGYVAADMLQRTRRPRRR